jgi:hypothetical protein
VRDVKLKDVCKDRVYWIKKNGKWKLCSYMEHDYPDGTSGYFFDLRNHVKIFNFDKIERIVEVDEPADATEISR